MTNDRFNLMCSATAVALVVALLATIGAPRSRHTATLRRGGKESLSTSGSPCLQVSETRLQVSAISSDSPSSKSNSQTVPANIRLCQALGPAAPYPIWGVDSLSSGCSCGEVGWD